MMRALNSMRPRILSAFGRRAALGIRPKPARRLVRLTVDTDRLDLELEEKEGGLVEVTLRGDLTRDTIGLLHRWLTPLRGRLLHLALHLRDVRNVDDAAVTCLLDVMREVSRSGETVRIDGSGPSLQRILNVAGPAVFPLFSRAARAELRGVVSRANDASTS